MCTKRLLVTTVLPFIPIEKCVYIALPPQRSAPSVRVTVATGAFKQSSSFKPESLDQAKKNVKNMELCKMVTSFYNAIKGNCSTVCGFRLCPCRYFFLNFMQ